MTAETPPFNPYIALSLGIISVSFGAIFARLSGEADALVISAYRVGLASIILFPIAWLKVRDELSSLSMADLRFAALSGFFLAMHFAAWISSLDYTSVANSVVLVNTNPLWVGILTPFIAKEKMSITTKIGIFISVIGGTIIGIGDISFGSKALLGDGLAIVGSMCAAIYLLIGRTIRQKLSLLAYIMVCYGSAAVILWSIVLFLKLPITGFGTKTFSALCAIALIPQLIGHTSYNWSLKWVSANMIAVSLLGEPIGSTILAYFIFGESLTWAKVIGGGLILSAIRIASAGERVSDG
jgi:drug/metabolite transporter (DMT)-like permease